MWRHSISTWRHEVKELTVHILASRCDRKMILVLFLWFFRSLSSKMSLIFYFWDTVTSWRHVMTSLNVIHLSQLDSFLFPWFCRSLSSKILMILHLYDVMTSWRHVMTPQNCLTYIRLWIHYKDDRFQDSMVFWLLILEMLVFMYLWDDIMSWRHVMTSRQYLASLYSTY